MKALLMHPDRDFDLDRALPWNARDLTQDLELGTLLDAMAGDDEFVVEVARKALLHGFFNDMETILYRQEALRDCLKNQVEVAELYSLTVETIAGTKKGWWGHSSRHASSMLYNSLDLLELLSGMLRRLRGIAERAASRFQSQAFTALFAMLEKELSDEYLAAIDDHLTELKFRKGTWLSAELGEANEGANYELRRPREDDRNWLRRLLGKGPAAYTFHIAERDETGARILSEVRQRGLSRVATALARSTDHVVDFFKMLRTELAFYVGCLKLHDRLTAKGEPVCFPTPAPSGERRRRFSGLYDVCLSLHMERRVVGNEIDGDGMSLTIVTGANQGGKSTFLRSIGLAQAMMQSGMFVAAETFTAELCPSLLTHFRREEDPTMKSGQLDEELGRMSEIVDHIEPNSIVLLNESFAATNEREGSEIAKQIVSALLEKRIAIFYVTHLYDFARGFFDKRRGDAIYLRAERRADGTRTFKVLEGEPLETSHGEDLYRQIFETNGQFQDEPFDDASSTLAV